MTIPYNCLYPTCPLRNSERSLMVIIIYFRNCLFQKNECYVCSPFHAVNSSCYIPEFRGLPFLESFSTRSTVMCYVTNRSGWPWSACSALATCCLYSVAYRTWRFKGCPYPEPNQSSYWQLSIPSHYGKLFHAVYVLTFRKHSYLPF